MAMQTITFELPDSLYRSIRRIAAITERPVESVVKEGLSHVLPPLDDLSEEEVDSLAALSQLDDAALWREARDTLTPDIQEELKELLERQGAGDLPEEARPRLEGLMGGLVRSHCENLMHGCSWPDAVMVSPPNWRAGSKLLCHAPISQKSSARRWQTQHIIDAATV